jgi:hypothetical protein
LVRLGTFPDFFSAACARKSAENRYDYLPRLAPGTELTVDRARAILSYDPETGVLRYKLDRPGGPRKGDIAGCASDGGRLILMIDGILYKAHRLAWLIHYGEWPRGEVTHLDRDLGNNRIANLRVVTRVGVTRAMSRSKRNVSGTKGVTPTPDRKKWRAHIGVGGKSIYLGSYDGLHDAVRARKAAEARYWHTEPEDMKDVGDSKGAAS